MGETVEMIDLHTHILPGLDDGAQTIEESIQMCLVSYMDGVKTIIATPHILNGIYHNNRRTILAKVQELNLALYQCGMRIAECGLQNQKFSKNSEFRIPNSELRVLPGADVHFSPDILQRYAQGEIETLIDGGRF